MKSINPIILCVSLSGLCGAILGAVGPSGDPLELALGLGFMGFFPGLLWKVLEGRLEDVAAGRRRLVTCSLLSFLAMGAAGALLMSGLALGFSQGMKALGFLPPSNNLPKVLALGFVYGSLPGLLVGYLLAAARTFLTSSRG
ncbi:hypothetical protein JST97_36715 [bacterium]|nr:hypothetical protein [bacterium]